MEKSVCKLLSILECSRIWDSKLLTNIVTIFKPVFHKTTKKSKRNREKNYEICGRFCVSFHSVNTQWWSLSTPRWWYRNPRMREDLTQKNRGKKAPNSWSEKLVHADRIFAWWCFKWRTNSINGYDTVLTEQQIRMCTITIVVSL